MSQTAAMVTYIIISIIVNAQTEDAIESTKNKTAQ